MKEESVVAPATPPRGPALTPSDVLLALADRCEREEPSRELDIAIGMASGKKHPFDIYMPKYTTSLDAAVTLMGERGWGLTWDIESVYAGGLGLPGNIGVCAYVWTGHMTHESTFRRSPPVATFAEAVKWLPRLICAAALRARAAALDPSGITPSSTDGEDALSPSGGGEMAQPQTASRSPASERSAK